MRRTWWWRLDAALGGLGRPAARLAAVGAGLAFLALGAALGGLILTAFLLLALAAFAGLLAPVVAYIGWSEARDAGPRSQVNLRPSRSFGGPAILPSSRSQARGWRGGRRGLPDDFGKA